MRNNVPENLMEHSFQVAVIAQALALIKNKKFGASVDVDKVVSVALFHDAGEVFTGDMPTPIKYNNPKIKEAYKDIEAQAEKRIVSMLPEEFKPYYKPLISPDGDSEEFRIVKRADKLSAYIKCLEETASGNAEFSLAGQSTKAALEKEDSPEVKYFIDKFLQSFFKPLDAL